MRAAMASQAVQLRDHMITASIRSSLSGHARPARTTKGTFLGESTGGIFGEALAVRPTPFAHYMLDADVLTTSSARMVGLRRVGNLGLVGGVPSV